MATGKQLRRLRETAGLKQFTVAEAAGLANGVLCKIERGRDTCDAATVNRIVRAIVNLRQKSGEAYEKALTAFDSEEGAQ